MLPASQWNEVPSQAKMFKAVSEFEEIMQAIRKANETLVYA